jgi:hypothetical protein
MRFMNEWRLDDSLNEMHDLFLATCVMVIYDTLAWCKTRFRNVLMNIPRRTHTWFDQLANHSIVFSNLENY